MNRSRQLAALRFLGVVAIGLMAACGSSDGGSSDPSTTNSNPNVPNAPTTNDPTTTGEADDQEAEPTLVGDRGPGWDLHEVDPTLQPGYQSPQSLHAGPTKQVLSFTWLGQKTGYWCGPGSVHMAIGTRDANPPSQQTLATFMGTTKSGTARADAVNALNHWLSPPTPYQSVPVDAQPTTAQRDLLKQTILDRIGAGYPVIANVLSGWRPPGYPSGTIGHFVAVVGYDDDGDSVLIADPAGDGAPGPRWVNVPKSYWITTHNLGTWVGGRGYSH